MGSISIWSSNVSFTYEDVLQVDDGLEVSDAEIFQLGQKEETGELEDPHHDQDDVVGIGFEASVPRRVDLVGVDEVQDEPVEVSLKVKNGVKYPRKLGRNLKGKTERHLKIRPGANCRLASSS